MCGRLQQPVPGAAGNDITEALYGPARLLKQRCGSLWIQSMHRDEGNTPEAGGPDWTMALQLPQSQTRVSGKFKGPVLLEASRIEGVLH